MTRFKTNIQRPIRYVLLIWLVAIFISLPVLIFARNVPFYKVVDGREELLYIRCAVMWNYTVFMRFLSGDVLLQAKLVKLEKE